MGYVKLLDNFMCALITFYGMLVLFAYYHSVVCFIDTVLVIRCGFLRSDNDAKPLGPNVWCETG